MPTLHTISRSPHDGSALESCLRVALPGAALMLIENGVYAAVAGAAHEARIREALLRHPVYALGPDLAARGIAAERIVDGVVVVDDAGFVALAVEYAKVQAWL